MDAARDGAVLGFQYAAGKPTLTSGIGTQRSRFTRRVTVGPRRHPPPNVSQVARTLLHSARLEVLTGGELAHMCRYV